ncbi:hypothetical protein BC832DRAFT_363496 [Gaertneriomyces semiglobifer]|nr:hypothetical protein BC832DRAFT_363496 [Gaertneriomyces semiglobifer]
MSATGKRHAKVREFAKGWSEERRARLLEIPELRTILEFLELDKPSTFEVASATAAQILKVTALDFTKNQRFGYSNWDLGADNALPSLTPSNAFTEHVCRVNKWFTPEKEALTRSLVDGYILEAAEVAEKEGLRSSLVFFGELSIRQHNPETQATLSGSMDNVFAYADGQEEYVHNIFLIGVAKNQYEPFGGRRVLQLFGYMAMVFRARQRAKKTNPGVFGFITNGAFWIFARIDNDGSIWQSAVFSDEATVLRHLSFVLIAATAASPSTTPYGCVENLSESSLSEAFDSLPGFEATTRTTTESRLDAEVENFFLETAGNVEESEDDDTSPTWAPQATPRSPTRALRATPRSPSWALPATP